MRAAEATPPKHLGEAWNWLFHAPRDLRVCAMLRIGYALLVLIWLAVLYGDLQLWFGEQGVLPLSGAQKVMPPYCWSLLQWLPAGESMVTAAYTVAMVQTLLLLVGFLSRFQAACVFVWVVSFSYRNYVILDAEDAVFRLLGFLLIWMPAGARWSVDAWLRHRPLTRGIEQSSPGATPATLGPAWALRLVQFQMCVIFLSAGICKLQAPQWRDGTAMYYVSRLDDYFGRFPTPDLLWQTPLLVRLITWGTVAMELMLPLVIWWPPARRWVLIALLSFHLANEYTMHLFLFHWIMLVGWASFLTGKDLDALKALLHPRTPGDRPVFHGEASAMSRLASGGEGRQSMHAL